MFEVIVVGGGSAGLSAALTLGRTHRHALVLDSGAGRNAPAEAVHNFFTRDGVPPARIREIAHEQLRSYPTIELRNGTVQGVRQLPEHRGFAVRLTDGGEVESKRLLLASGVVDELPDITGIAQLWGRSVFHCPYCHGFEASGRSIAVIGATPDRIRLALHLSRFSSDVALCTDGATDLPEAARGPLAAAGIPVHTGLVAEFRSAGTKLAAIAFADGGELPREAAFVTSTPVRRSPLPEQLGCSMFADTTVEVDEFHQTSVTGVYAAGDMARRASVPMPFAAVITAAAAGTIAASAIDQDLLSHDFGLPNPLSAGRH
ncbi:NAD(P)/FAD-dependent oxidoreductase [Nocardia cyriacigeorgica]|uniref:NAD(P)/FAD-dependent oxidoreductase n=1 Tax=Nocardia cyriacigeorgica TaxID=135487 RepID=UPI0013B6551A|nr:NAD(P)/FAD-dependent oxidoreductase [Nocardia cyriacigeorgica]NEW48990.1 NAD(P)/FAD-dependent oxidoreductase [Nocardia cyriacigeorgica]